MNKILYINACVRENSRTNILAKYLLGKLDGDIEEVKLNSTNISPLAAETLKLRDEFIYKTILPLLFLITLNSLKMSI